MVGRGGLERPLELLDICLGCFAFFIQLGVDRGDVSNRFGLEDLGDSLKPDV